MRNFIILYLRTTRQRVFCLTSHETLQQVCVSSFFPFKLMNFAESLCQYSLGARGGHRHLQIGRMLDIALISEPPPLRCMYSKCGNLCGQKGQEAIHSLLGSQDVTYLSLHPMHLPPGYRSKVESRHFAHLYLGQNRRVITL